MPLSRFDFDYLIAYLGGGACLAVGALGLADRISLAYGVSIALIIAGIVVICLLPTLLDAFRPSSSRSSRINYAVKRIPQRGQEESLLPAATSFSSSTEHDQHIIPPIVYHPAYNITACGLESLHPFDSQKYGRVFKTLCESQSIDSYYEPVLPSQDDLLLVHPRSHLPTLHSTFRLTGIVEVPVCCLPSYVLRARVLEPMLLGTAGTILAGRFALKEGIAINLGGGYHHASRNSGGGFCAYADLTLSIQHLRRDFPSQVRKVMIVDLDAHQGNGHERDFANDPDCYIMDVFNPRIYPGDMEARRAIRKQVHVFSTTSDEKYLQLVEENLKDSLLDFSPDIVYYNAGTDCMEGDPLGNLNVSPQGIIRRDEIVFQLCRARNIPVVMVLSGGYQMSNAPVIAASVQNLLAKFFYSSRRAAEDTGDHKSK